MKNYLTDTGLRLCLMVSILVGYSISFVSSIVPFAFALDVTSNQFLLGLSIFFPIILSVPIAVYCMNKSEKFFESRFGVSLQ